MLGKIVVTLWSVVMIAVRMTLNILFAHLQLLSPKTLNTCGLLKLH